jgi:hypothetical protein
MIVSLCLLLLCQLAGEAVARAARLPAPGLVVGMSLLFGLLLLRDRLPFLPREMRMDRWPPSADPRADRSPGPRAVKKPLAPRSAPHRL